MKFSTAIAFVLSGIILFFIRQQIVNDSIVAPVILPGATLGLLLLMSKLLISQLFDFTSGIEDLFVKEADGAIQTTVPGRPSVGTMINFIIIGITGVYTIV